MKTGGPLHLDRLSIRTNGLQNAHRSDVNQQGSVCDQALPLAISRLLFSPLSVYSWLVSVMVELLFSPLSVYSWLVSVMVKLLFSSLTLISSSLYYTVLLLLAGPCCIATLSLSVLVSCLRVVIYMVHLVLVLCALAVLAIMTPHKMADVNGPKMADVNGPKMADVNGPKMTAGATARDQTFYDQLKLQLRDSDKSGISVGS
ncbi:uncharacterized protein LOC118936866 isoform X1 [Oncorhynchus mykiss]|uniref:uncharacterized protein LOC118936866 isoform X1 n=1 Tax=Oncorhynchus mykiss TaxID=8022 RepID=UPI001877C6D3|nr:uncharacterized protein LOC118936866 isoform X1 [Oncorhynchus mykiss]